MKTRRKKVVVEREIGFHQVKLSNRCGQCYLDGLWNLGTGGEMGLTRVHSEMYFVM